MNGWISDNRRVNDNERMTMKENDYDRVNTWINKWMKGTCGCPEWESLDHVAHGLNAPVSDDWHTETSGILCHLIHRGALRPPARHHYGRRRQETRNLTMVTYPMTGVVRRCSGWARWMEIFTEVILSESRCSVKKMINMSNFFQ